MNPTTPFCDQHALSLQQIHNSTASRMTYFVPLDIAESLELALQEAHAKVKALEQDKRRLDWLDENNTHVDVDQGQAGQSFCGCNY